MTSSATRRPDFRAVWWKIERARQHRELLHRDAVKYFGIEGNRPSCVGKYDASRGYHSFRITYVPAMLRQFLLYSAITIGDVAHNLRSALDHVAYQLARAEAARIGTPFDDWESVYFPIHTGRPTKPSWSAKENLYMRRFGAANAALIKTFQPYRGRAGRTDYWSGRFRHELTLLNRFSNRDKHRLPTVVAAFPSDLRMIQPIPISLRFDGFEFVSQRVILGAEAFRARVGGATDHGMDVEAHVVPLIALPDGSQVDVQMERMILFVAKIVRAFDPDGQVPERPI